MHPLELEEFEVRNHRGLITTELRSSIINRDKFKKQAIITKDPVLCAKF